MHPGRAGLLQCQCSPTSGHPLGAGDEPTHKDSRRTVDDLDLPPWTAARIPFRHNGGDSKASLCLFDSTPALPPSTFASVA